MSEQYLTSDEQFKLAEKVSRAIAEYEDGSASYPYDVVRMPLAEYVVGEVIDEWVKNFHITQPVRLAQP